MMWGPQEKLNILGPVSSALVMELWGYYSLALSHRCVLCMYTCVVLYNKLDMETVASTPPRPPSRDPTNTKYYSINSIYSDYYLSRNNTSGPPDMVFNVWCALSPHTAVVPQWPVGGIVAFLTGRLGVSHIIHISRDDYLSRSNTSGPPDTVFYVGCALSPYTAAVPQWPVGSNWVFLTGRLRVFPIRQISGVHYMVQHYTSRPQDLSSNV